MGWETRHGRKYFYRSVRDGDRVRKRYFGAGFVGRRAARTYALRRAEQRAQKEAWQAAMAMFDTAEEQLSRLEEGCKVVMDAALYSYGFHRPTRHAWRRWRNGRRALREGFGNDGAG